MFFSGIEDGINNLNRMFCGNILNIKIGEKRRTNEDILCFITQESFVRFLTMSKENN